nr:MAG TPA: hypothetical protein [Caudoviricetes sp.]
MAVFFCLKFTALFYRTFSKCSPISFLHCSKIKQQNQSNSLKFK